MKHKVIALTAALSMLGGSIAALPAMAAGNIVDNGAFDSNADSWESTGSNALSWVGTHADKQGVANIAANASDASGDAHGIMQDLLSKGIEPDSTYTFEADIYTLDTTNETATFNIYFLTSWTPPDCYGQPTASNIVAGGGMQLKPNQWNHVEYTLETPAEDSDLWKKVKGEYSYSSSETKTETPAAKLNLTIESDWGTNAEFYIDNITLTKVGDEPGGDPGDTDVAEVNGEKYTSLDDAIANATSGATVTVLKDTELSSVVTNPIKLKGADGILPTVTIKAATGDTTALFAGDTTLENIVLTGGEASATSETPKYERLVSWGGSLTINSSTIKNLAFNQESYGTFNFNNVTFSGIYKEGWFLSTSGDSTLSNVTATGNDFKYSYTGFIATTVGATTFENCIIKDNNGCRAIWTGDNTSSNTILNGGNELAPVTIGKVGTLTINEETPMSELQIDDPAIYSLVLGADFGGTLNIPLTEETAVANKTVANVVSGANTDGITVTGMDTENTVLKVVGGKLVIAEKAAPAEFTATVRTAEVQHGTGKFEDTVATGFQATVTNNGGTKGTFNTVKWNVTLGDETKTTGDQPITNVTLDPNAKATIFLVVNNLGDENATATVEIK